MHFHVEHTTEYVYSEPATEAFSELRMRPRDSPRQNMFRPQTKVDPAVAVDSYKDYFGNHVEIISIPFRHTQLTVTSSCDVITAPLTDVMEGLDLTIEEARLIYRDKLRELHDFLRPSPLVPFTRALREMAGKRLRRNASFTHAIRLLNEYIFTTFKYTPGATDVGTTVADFLQSKKGVCQDFAHLMICLCRNAGIPARYVSGYIETDPPKNTTSSKKPSHQPRLIGATASHAWVQIYTPNHFWIGIDPTNNKLEDERHVQIGIGRDYTDVPPLKGIFKGAQKQQLNVEVKVRRHEMPKTDLDSDMLSES